MPRHVRKGDTVIVTAGDARGQTGLVTRVIPKEERVIVQGLNLRTRHLKPSRVNPQGGMVSRESPIHISNVSPVSEGRATRVRFVMKDDGSKVRVAARGGKELGVIHAPRGERPAGERPVATPAAPGVKKQTTKKTTKKVAAKPAGAKKTTKKAPAPKKSAGTRKKSES